MKILTKRGLVFYYGGLALALVLYIAGVYWKTYEYHGSDSRRLDRIESHLELENE